MTVSSIDAGKTLCELSGWQTSNLRLQKLLYIAHMYYMRGGNGDLVRENFEAWKFGPVEPGLYHYCKVYGADPIGRIFPKNGGVKHGSPEFKILDETIKAAEGITEAALVSFTHWEKGAWHKTRERGEVLIPRGFIKEECEARDEVREERRRNNDQH